MTSALRVMDTGLRPARANVAMTAALAELHRAGRIGDTLRFHRYPRSVLIGRHQTLCAAVHIGEAGAAGIEIARRATGGGAVYMAPGALAWDIVAASRRFGTRDEAAATICQAVAAALSSLGLAAARYRPPNDIAVAGRKICGASGFFDGPTLAYQGTILIDADASEMERFLVRPEPRRGDAPAGFASRVTTFAAALGRMPLAGEIEDAVAAALARALGCGLAAAVSSAEEEMLAEELLRRQFGRDRFVDSGDDDEMPHRDAVRPAPAHDEARLP